MKSSMMHHTTWDATKMADKYGYYKTTGVYGLLIGAGIHFVFVIMFAYLDMWRLSVVSLMGIPAYLYAISITLASDVHHRSPNIDGLIGWIIYVDLITFGTSFTYFFGRDSGFFYPIYGLVGLPFFITSYSTIVVVLRRVAVVGIIFFVELCSCFDHQKIDISSDIISAMHFANLLMFLVTITLFMFVYADKIQAYQNDLRHKDQKDPDTGLYSRNFILKTFAASTDKPFAVAVINLDQLKVVNQNHTCQCGDHLIREVASIIHDGVDQETAQETIMVARWSGQEFLVVFVNTELAQVRHTLEVLQQQVADHVAVCNYKMITTTVTIGAAYSQAAQSDFDTLLIFADDALLSAKEKGRNRIEIKEIV